MGKVSGSYDSTVFGVSEQVEHARRSGQCSEQINMISDPVHGLIRRRGSVWQDEQTVVGDFATLSPEGNAMRVFDFVVAGVEYSLLYRKESSTLGKPSFMYCYNKTTKKFIQIVYENSTFVNTLISGGVSAIASAGKYVFIAGNDTRVTYTQVDNWSPVANSQHSAVWIRGGAYDRTFTVTCYKADGSTVVGQYHTLSSGYPGVLDTSDILLYDPPGSDTINKNYQKEINDRVNAYNSAAALWIGKSAADIVPQNIAEKIAADLSSKGIIAKAKDGHVFITDTDIIEVSADDGGDKTLVRWVGQLISSPSLVTDEHFVGKIVRVRPQGSTDAESYYLEAVAHDGHSTGWAEVTWRESAGVVCTPQTMLAMANVYNDILYIAKDGPGLHALDGQDHPTFKSSIVGDGVSSPVPEFFDNPITMLSLFQDRLIVGAGGTVNASVTGDYLNFFRATVLAIKDTDPVEMYSYGSEGDTLRHSVMYDRSLILFGDLKQYAISGQEVLTANRPLIVTISAHENGTRAVPVASGNFVFYTKYAEGRTSMHQLQFGQLLTTPVSYEVSQQLDTYIKGSPAQLTANTSPNMILFRTETQADTFYVYQYLDDPAGGQRLYDSWSRWRFASQIGTVIGTSTYLGEVLIFTMRQAAGQTYVVADKINLSNELSDKAYFDSAKPYSALGNSWHSHMAAADLQVAADNSSTYFLMGSTLDNVANLIEQLPGVETSLWVGAYDDCYYEPTNPFVRDRNGKAILSGRLTLGQLIPTVADTGGCVGKVSTVNGNITNLQFEGRLLGRSSNIIAQQPLVTGALNALVVGREVRECVTSFNSETWLPMNITALDWVGQFFNRVRRV